MSQFLPGFLLRRQRFIELFFAERARLARTERGGGAGLAEADDILTVTGGELVQELAEVPTLVLLLWCRCEQIKLLFVFAFWFKIAGVDACEAHLDAVARHGAIE